MDASTSLLLTPSFLTKLADPAIRTVFMTGCGGGFDFVHCMLLYPELKRLGKTIVIGSYSFGDPEVIDNAEIVKKFPRNPGEGDYPLSVARVNAQSKADPRYGPEVGICAYLDKNYPEDAPHHVYANYARSFTVKRLTELYGEWVEKHQVDAVVMVDGGSDSLMAGDESGLGDPIEDCVSITTCAQLKVPLKLLLTVGFGCDRFNDVSDAASLRAVAELTQSGGFLGCVSLEPTNPCFQFYTKAIEFLNGKFLFHSVIANSIVESGKGSFGFAVPPSLRHRVKPGQLYLWPLMAILWGFDAEKVAERSLCSQAIRECETVKQMYIQVHEFRSKLENGVRKLEHLPPHPH